MANGNGSNSMVQVVISERTGETMDVPQSTLDRGAELGLDAATVAKSYRGVNAAVLTGELQNESKAYQTMLLSKSLAAARRSLLVADMTREARIRAKLADRKLTEALSPKPEAQTTVDVVAHKSIEAESATTPVINKGNGSKGKSATV